MAWNDNYVYHTPYLSKHTSYDHVFSYTSLKWWYLQMVFFSIFSKFWVLRGGRRVTGQKVAQNNKKFSLTYTCYLRNCSSYDCVFWYTCVKWWYLQHFFHFFKSLIFQLFQSSSVNGKWKFWGIPHLLHMCVIFIDYFYFLKDCGASHLLQENSNDSKEVLIWFWFY